MCGDLFIFKFRNCYTFFICEVYTMPPSHLIAYASSCVQILLGYSFGMPPFDYSSWRGHGQRVDGGGEWVKVRANGAPPPARPTVPNPPRHPSVLPRPVPHRPPTLASSGSWPWQLLGLTFSYFPIRLHICLPIFTYVASYSTGLKVTSWVWGA